MRWSPASPKGEEERREVRGTEEMGGQAQGEGYREGGRGKGAGRVGPA